MLDLIFSNNDQRNKYHQVWKEIFKIINDKNGELKMHEKIRLFDSNLPIEKIIKIPSITIIIKSLILFRTFTKSLFVRNIKLNYKDVRIQ